jgi:hypothetical protein
MIRRRILLAAGNLGLWVLTIGVLIFLLFPLIVVVPESFSPSAILQFPPAGLSLRWYRDFFSDPASRSRCLRQCSDWEPRSHWSDLSGSGGHWSVRWRFLRS